jgi:hypothetical protein
VSDASASNSTAKAQPIGGRAGVDPLIIVAPAVVVLLLSIGIAVKLCKGKHSAKVAVLTVPMQSDDTTVSMNGTVQMGASVGTTACVDKGARAIGSALNSNGNMQDGNAHPSYNGDGTARRLNALPVLEDR